MLLCNIVPVLIAIQQSYAYSTTDEPPICELCVHIIISGLIFWFVDINEISADETLEINFSASMN